MSVLLQRARTSGQCPPSLLSEERVVNVDKFEDDVLSLIPAVGFCLRSDDDVPRNFSSVLQKVRSISNVSSGIPIETRRKTLEYRRGVLLALVGGTSKDDPSLATIVINGFLTEIKLWLDDALTGGSIDFLLHLLSNLVHLPVTKAAIKDSGLGKAVGALEKHPLCKGTPNETAIIQRVQQIKEVWHARVKAQKVHDPPAETSGPKRPADPSSASPSASKKAKTAVSADDSKKVSSFASLLKKVAATANGGAAGAKAASALIKSADGRAGTIGETGTEASTASIKKEKEKKTARRVKWADHFGGKLFVAQDSEGEESESVQQTDATVSWSDRKKRDRLREKELLSKAKKSKLMDDGDDEGLELVKIIKPSSVWRIPELLPDRPDVSKAQLESPEIHTQSDRIKTVVKTSYLSDSDVPDSPLPLSDAEQALDLTSQGSAIISNIPFFVPQATAVATPTTQAIAYPVTTQAYTQPQSSYVMAPLQYENFATAEFVQSLGLPMFLVGESKSALQTLAGSPSLLSTLVDANGMYDQPRLMNLVKTLSASTGGAQSQTIAQAPSYQAPLASYGGASNNHYGQATPYQPTTKLVVDKSVEGNLHVSGYGAGTTEADLIASFSPYVRVNEVIMKGTFAFVNTSDPAAAARAKEALSGTLIGGMPIKINQATRKAKEPQPVQITPATSMAPYASSRQQTPLSVYGNPMAPMAVVPPIVAPMSHIPGTVPAVPDIDAVRDDRGNPATKNLFIAGYGPTTTEQQLRDVVSQYVRVVGVILKGTFSFVNTTDRESAVYAREMLGGTMLNGGVIRINFAKETGRLGTSFDLTYGPNTGPNAHKNQAQRNPPASMSYYGRGGGGY